VLVARERSEQESAMGQAVDLPDPLDTESPLNAPLNNVTGSAAHGESADDLLSQLAGDEIDRLLAEADVEPSVPAGVSPAVSTAAPQPESKAEPAPENIHSVLDGAAAFATAPPESSSLVEDDLDAHLTQASFDDAAQIADPSITAAHLNLHTAVEEKGPAASEDDDEFERPLPVVLKPLAWLNAPFDAMSDAIREALGKVALLTLLNAIAVLIYVLVFRR